MRSTLTILLITFLLSCSKNKTLVSDGNTVPPVLPRLTSCDSITQGLIKSTSDSIRLLSCIKIQSCDSVRLGLINLTFQDTLRLLACLKISSDDSLRIGLLKIGNNYGGGIIAYFLLPGDNGYVANEKHGLIVATKNELYLDGRWAPTGFLTLANTELSIGSGLLNTDKIIAAQGSNYGPKYAAGVARAAKYGGYTDWFLPSRDELSKICLNKDIIGLNSFDLMWTSSEDYQNDRTKIWFYRLQNCKPSTSVPTTQYAVRAVRAF